MHRVLVFILLSFLAKSSLSAVVLQYHHVSAETPASTSIDPKLFAEHLNYLAEHEYQVWPLLRLVEKLKANEPLPDKVVVITFDDAYQSIYQHAFPLLKARSWPFTVFVATDAVDHGDRPYMSWQQLRELNDHGGTIANHSRTHSHFVRRRPSESSKAWMKRIEAEIVYADQRIQSELNEAPKLLAYPYGEYTSEIMLLVARLGFVAFGQQSGAIDARMDLRSLPRFPMTNQFGAMEQFKTKVASLALPIEKISPSSRIIDQNTLAQGLSIRFANINQAVTCYLSGVGRVSLNQQKSTVVLPQIPKLPAGRSRINCTAPSAQPGRFHWASYFWMKPLDDGNWYQEE